ncbi:MAG: hypothetical protein JRJ29_00465 [Deltaproteobacteria bacterium]|nr:hypothetical protein [Deltaproteobacteria bacterium]MBW2081641.1 hypothetical protein [Deltaproteobacteria bacterium]
MPGWIKEKWKDIKGDIQDWWTEGEKYIYKQLGSRTKVRGKMGTGGLNKAVSAARKHNAAVAAAAGEKKTRK